MWFLLGSPSCLESGWKYVLDVKVSGTKLEYWNVLKLHFFLQVQKQEILPLIKKLHYPRSARVNKFTSEIIRFKEPFLLILQFLDGSVEIS